MKLRTDSTLNQLTPDQREQLYDWLISHSAARVQELAAKPEADGGFNLKLHRQTLLRFFQREQAERQALELVELAAASDIQSTPAELESLLKATRVKFIRATYDLSKTCTDTENYDRLGAALHRFELVQLKREELALRRDELKFQQERAAEQKRQWEFDAAREVMIRFLEYQKIHRRKDINEKAKIWEARGVTFYGKTAEETVPPAAPIEKGSPAAIAAISAALKAAIPPVLPGEPTQYVPASVPLTPATEANHAAPLPPLRPQSAVLETSSAPSHSVTLCNTNPPASPVAPAPATPAPIEKASPAAIAAISAAILEKNFPSIQAAGDQSHASSKPENLQPEDLKTAVPTAPSHSVTLCNANSPATSGTPAPSTTEPKLDPQVPQNDAGAPNSSFIPQPSSLLGTLCNALER